MRKLHAAPVWIFLAASPYFLFSQNSTSTNPVSSANAKKKKKKKTVARRRTTAPKPPRVSEAVRALAAEDVSGMIDRTAGIPIENPAAMVPFFEQLRRVKAGEAEGPLSILHYGDSHTAADAWTGSLRSLLQGQFGDGGGGYSLAGSPFVGYRREDLKSGESRGWHSEGLLSRTGDGLYGLGGVSIATTLSGQSVYLEGECSRMELFYLLQPGGGALRLYDNGEAMDTIATNGALGPGYFQYHVKQPGTHRFELETLQHAPVRLFGWVTEKDSGVTYETLGINGAQASILFRWDEGMLASNIARRNPALIVLAYGTNEASNPDWTQDNYREMFCALLQRLRQDAPTASILVLGPPDRDYRLKGRWLTMDKLDRIVAAQREAALSNRCAFWDMREKMGGKGSMPEWVTAGLAQYDHVHFTAPGYRRLGYTLFRDLMYNYDKYTKVRAELARAGSNDQTTADR